AAKSRSALVSAVTEADMREIAQRLVARGKMGHLDAVEVLLKYVLGGPLQPADPDKVDQAEWELFRASPAAMALVQTLVDTTTFEAALGILRQGRLGVQRILAGLPHPQQQAEARPTDSEDKAEG